MEWHDVLQIEQMAGEATIKKQYRKSALWVHSSKNKAPVAVNAFDRVWETHCVHPQKAKLHNIEHGIVSWS